MCSPRWNEQGVFPSSGVTRPPVNLTFNAATKQRLMEIPGRYLFSASEDRPLQHGAASRLFFWEVALGHLGSEFPFILSTAGWQMTTLT
jgi:hypothetical protein